MGLIERIIASVLHARLAPHCQQTGCGRAFVETTFAAPGRENDRIPDVAFVSTAARPIGRPFPRVNAWPIAPDLAVEVISPGDKMFDVFDKLEEYFVGGVKQVWHVPSVTEEVFCYSSPAQVRILTAADELTGDPVVPGFRVPVADPFPPAEPPAEGGP